MLNVNNISLHFRSNVRHDVLSLFSPAEWKDDRNDLEIWKDFSSRFHIRKPSNQPS